MQMSGAPWQHKNKEWVSHIGKPESDSEASGSAKADVYFCHEK